jgi:hypothetical protein
MGLKSADMSTVEQVQWRRGWHRHGHWHGGRVIGPAVGGFVAGAIVGSALAAPRYYDDGYYAYGAAPGYVGPRRWPQSSDTPAPGSSPLCGATSDSNSAYPSWMCR